MGHGTLFSMGDVTVGKVESSLSDSERHLQDIFEHKLCEKLGIRYLDTQYVMGTDHPGRIDTLGLDENNCPVIIEYKRSKGSVIDQVLYYFDGIRSNKAEFKLLVLKKLGSEVADKVNFNGTRILCIAGAYTKYDLCAVKHVKPKIELIEYKHFGNRLLLECRASSRRTKALMSLSFPDNDEKKADAAVRPSLVQKLTKADATFAAFFDTVHGRLLGFGEDVRFADGVRHRAFKRIGKNFTSLVVCPRKKYIKMYINVDPNMVKLEPGFTRDVRHTGHNGNGYLEVVVKSATDLERAMTYSRDSYETA
jgi:predicted transport protein